MADTLFNALPDEVERLVDEVLTLACDGDLKIATAESCTGGLVSALLTDVEGKSHAFDRGFSVYTDDAKHEMLGIAHGLIEEHGAVSAEVARAMAEGALTHSHADAALAITGYAGSAGPDGEPGLCFLAAKRKGGRIIDREMHYGDVGRAAVREAACITSLEMLREVLT